MTPKINFRVKLVLILLLSICNFSYAGYTLKNPQVYVLKEEYTLTNPSKEKVYNLEVSLHNGNKTPFRYATLMQTNYSPEPIEIVNDSTGNKTLKYFFDELKGGASIKFVNTYTIQSVDIIYNNDTVQDLTAPSSIFSSPQENIESDNATIINLANKLCEGLTTDKEKAEMIARYVNTSIKYDLNYVNSVGNYGAVETLKVKKGVCQQLSQLFVALCRAVGIPARVITGYMLEDNVKVTNTWLDVNDRGHAWAEYYLKDNGWQAVELSIYSNDTTKYAGDFRELMTSKYIPEGVYEKENNAAYVTFIIRSNTNVELNWGITRNIKLKQAKTGEHKYRDVFINYWYYDCVTNISNMKLLNGYPNKTFKPESNMTKQEFLWVFERLQNHLGLAKTVPIELTNLNEQIKREEVIAFFSSILPEIDIYSVECDFKDIDDSPYRDAIISAYGNGFINGYENGKFEPHNSIKRSEIAKLLDTYLKMYS